MKTSLNIFRRVFKPSSIGLAWLPTLTLRRSITGSSTQWHQHDEHEIIFLVDGSVTYAFHGKPNVHLKGGEFLVIPKGEGHHLRDNLDTPSFRLGFNLASIAPKITSPLTRTEYSMLVKTLLSVGKTPFTSPDSIRADLIALAKLITTNQERKPIPRFTAVRIRLLCTRILFDCAEAISMRTRTAKKSPDNIDAAIAYIEKHAQEPLNLNALIQYIGYSRSQLFALFRQKTGLSPSAYHQRRRLTIAQQLLNTTNLTSEQVADELGFDSPTYFTYVFRRYFGITPIAFKTKKYHTINGGGGRKTNPQIITLIPLSNYFLHLQLMRQETFRLNFKRSALDATIQFARIARDNAQASQCC